MEQEDNAKGSARLHHRVAYGDSQSHLRNLHKAVSEDSMDFPIDRYVYTDRKGLECTHTARQRVALERGVSLMDQWSVLTNGNRTARVFVLCGDAPRYWHKHPRNEQESARRELSSEETHPPEIIFGLCRKVAVLLPEQRHSKSVFKLMKWIFKTEHPNQIPVGRK